MQQRQQVVVIGAGIVGLSTAWELVQAGHRVTLLERHAQVGQGTSLANGGQLSYRYVSPLADEGVPLKALRWLFDADAPLRFKPSLDLHQWRWLATFVARCSGAVNRRTTARLLALGAFSQQRFGALVREAALHDIALRAPGKLVIYRQAAEFAKVRAKLQAQAPGPERALDAAECLALEPALAQNCLPLAGGIFTESEAVADCWRVCASLAERLRALPGFALRQAEVERIETQGGALRALHLRGGEVLATDAVVLAAGLQSRALARPLGLNLPLYPLKGYSLTSPIGDGHRPPEVSVTDFEKKIVYARIGSQLRIAAMVDLVGEDERIDPQRIDSLQRAVQATFPQAADHRQARLWAGLRPATPSGAPLIGATPVRGLWLNVGHGALGFTFASATARIVSELLSGRASPLPLDGLTLRA